jgi:Ser/Thr protein kinase RdoA (MazF antagonist)
MDTAVRVRAVSARDPDRLTDDQATSAAAIALGRHAIDAAIEPLRTSANHVFRAGDVVVRVAPASLDVAAQVALARWLRSAGLPVAEPVADVELVGDARVSLWEHIDADEGRPIDFERLGEIVARLHRVAPERLRGLVALPFFGDAAWLGVEERLEAAAAANVVDADGIAALERACAALRGWQDRARASELVLCHGDVHPQNVLMRDDDIVLIDWDSICLAPPAWDHAALMTWPDRWGGAPNTYRDFARGYGADLSDSPLARDLAALRLLAPTLNMIINGAHDPVFAAQARARMRYWLGDPAAPTWTPL